MAQAYNIGDLIQYKAGHEVVDAKVFRKSGDRLWIDHRTFGRARVVRENSASVLGLAS